MAARRLIIILLVLFGISVVAASIAPDRKGGGILGDSSTTSTTTSSASTSSTTTTATPTPLPAGGESLTARIDASVSAPQTVKAFVGDQLDLNVGSERSRSIEIPDFGVTETAAADAPASFNLLLREPGEIAIIDAASGDIIGRLVVSKPAQYG
jgi:hypothetical protein